LTGRERVAKVLEDRRFQNFIIAVIVFNAVTLGMETSTSLMAGYGDLLHVLDHVALGIFVAELLAKFYAYRGGFFRDNWNVFDLLVVGIAVIPATGPFAVLRSLRVLRVLRLISVVPSMRKVVSGLLAAIPGMASIAALLALIIFVAGVMATKLFGAIDPGDFGDLGTSLFTLFQVMTGEAWPEIAKDVLPLHPSAWIFFVVYILISTFVVLNLFTAVVVSAMEPERREESEAEARLLAEVRALRGEVAAMRDEIRAERVG
jgi:voltage-gated sodium channel